MQPLVTPRLEALPDPLTHLSLKLLSQFPCIVSDLTRPTGFFLCSFLVAIIISDSQGSTLAPRMWVWSSKNSGESYLSNLSGATLGLFGS